MLGLELLIAAASVFVSVLGGGCGGIAAIFKLTRHLDERFDRTDKNIQELTHRYDVQRTQDSSRVDMLEYRLDQQGEQADHKTKRLENAIWQLSKYLEKNHNYHPRTVFPLERDD